MHGWQTASGKVIANGGEVLRVGPAPATARAIAVFTITLSAPAFVTFTIGPA